MHDGAAAIEPFSLLIVGNSSFPITTPKGDIKRPFAISKVGEINYSIHACTTFQ